MSKDNPKGDPLRKYGGARGTRFQLVQTAKKGRKKAQRAIWFNVLIWGACLVPLGVALGPTLYKELTGQNKRNRSRPQALICGQSPTAYLERNRDGRIRVITNQSRHAAVPAELYDRIANLELRSEFRDGGTFICSEQHPVHLDVGNLGRPDSRHLAKELGTLRALLTRHYPGVPGVTIRLAHLCDSAVRDHLNRHVAPLYLDFHQTDFSDAKLPCLEGLRAPEITIEFSSKIDDQRAAALARVGALRGLILRSNRQAPLHLTDQGLGLLLGLKKLRVLDLAGNAITDAGVARLGELPELESLGLSDTAVGAKGLGALAGLTRLRALELDPTSLGDLEVAAIGALKQLRRLSLGCVRQRRRNTCSLSAQAVASLAGLTRLEELRLNLPLDDAALGELAKLTKLQSLTLLQAEQVGDQGLAHLARLRGLHTLRLGRSQASDALLATLSQLPALRVLVLGSLRITGAHIAHLARLARLEILQIAADTFSDLHFQHVRKLRSLRWFRARSSRVSRPGLAELAKAMPGTRVDSGYIDLH